MKELLQKIQPKVIFWMNAVIAAIFAFGFIFFPKFVYELIGFYTDEDGLLMVRFFGFAVFTTSLLCFLVRNHKLSKTREAIQIKLAVDFTLMAITHIIVIAIRGAPLITNPFLWIVIVLHITIIPAYLFFIIRDWKKVRALGKEEEKVVV